MKKLLNAVWKIWKSVWTSDIKHYKVILQIVKAQYFV